MPFEYPIWLDDLLRRLGATLVPIALVSVGYQLHLSHVRGKVSALTVGLVFKLALAPALILLLFAPMLGSDGQVLSVTVFEAAMGAQAKRNFEADSRDRSAPSNQAVPRRKNAKLVAD